MVPGNMSQNKSDSFSATKAAAFEAELARAKPSVDGLPKEEKSHSIAGLKDAKNTDDKSRQSYDIVTLPRARRVHQPLLTTPFTALQTLVQLVITLTRTIKRQNSVIKDVDAQPKEFKTEQ